MFLYLTWEGPRSIGNHVNRFADFRKIRHDKVMTDSDQFRNYQTSLKGMALAAEFSIILRLDLPFYISYYLINHEEWRKGEVWSMNVFGQTGKTRGREAQRSTDQGQSDRLISEQ